MLQVFAENYEDLRKIRLSVETIKEGALDFRRVQENPPRIIPFMTPIRLRLITSGLAAEIEKVYTGMESALARIVQFADGELPKGEDWHRRLIRTAALPIPEGRPEIITKETAKSFDELRAFRHEIHHVYEEEILPEHVLNLATTTKFAYSNFVENLLVFNAKIEPALSPKTLTEIRLQLVLDTHSAER